MNTKTGLDRRAAAWLAEGPTELSDRVLDAALREVHVTQQRRDRWIPRRFSLMPTYLRYAAAVAIVAIISVGALTYFGNDRGPGSPTPSATPTPTATVLPTTSVTVLPPLPTADWIPYTSSRYGYSIAYPPAEWMVTPGDHDWAFDTDIDAFNSTAPDRFETQGAGEGLGIRLSVWTDNLDPGTTQQDWIGAYCAAAYVTGSCSEVTDLLSEVMWGGPARIKGWNNPVGEPMAAFVRGGTIYVLAIWRADNDPSVRPWGGSQRLLEAFLGTITLPGALGWESPAAG